MIDPVSARWLKVNLLKILDIVPRMPNAYITYAQCEEACKPRPAMEAVAECLQGGLLDVVRSTAGIVQRHKWKVNQHGREYAELLKRELAEPAPEPLPLQREDIRKATPVAGEPEDQDEELPPMPPPKTTPFAPMPNRRSSKRGG